MLKMIMIVTFIPLLNFFLCGLFGKLINRSYLINYVIASLLMTIFFLAQEFKNIICGVQTVTNAGSWITSELFYLNWNFLVDPLSYIMLIVVLVVSSLVHIYSTEYMKDDPHLIRFISYLSLFTFFMLILVTADNFITLFLGWEGVGLCSYLLISFWFTRVQANKAAIKAMIMNRIADLAYVLAVVVTFYCFQTLEFNAVFSLTKFLENSEIILLSTPTNPLSIIATLFFIGAMGKSAQIGLHTWLPDAMEGPTPVSALIHAATMVTAGVFLIIRSSILFESAPTVLFFIAAIGASTAFLAATAGLVQNDLKKIIAYSTCSQLGYMIFICGLSQYNLSLFHLANHAFFKALLFLSAGAVIHGISNEQDLRKQGGLLKIMPLTYVMFLIGSLALMGFPFLTGYYSKDIILESAVSTFSITGQFAYNFGVTTAILTSYYSFRLLHLAFYSKAKSYSNYATKMHELPFTMAICLLILSIGSIFGGYLAKDLFIGLGTPFWNSVITFMTYKNQALLEGEFLPISTKLIPFFGLIAAVLAVVVININFKNNFAQSYSSQIMKGFYRFFSHKWYFDLVYNKIINQPLLETAYRVIFTLIDRGVLEMFGPLGAATATLTIGKTLTKCQTSRVQDYAWLMLLFFYVYLIIIR